MRALHVPVFELHRVQKPLRAGDTGGIRTSDSKLAAWRLTSCLPDQGAPVLPLCRIQAGAVCLSLAGLSQSGPVLVSLVRVRYDDPLALDVGLFRPVSTSFRARPRVYPRCYFLRRGPDEGGIRSCPRQRELFSISAASPSVRNRLQKMAPSALSRFMVALLRFDTGANSVAVGAVVGSAVAVAQALKAIAKLDHHEIWALPSAERM